MTEQVPENPHTAFVTWMFAEASNNPSDILAGVHKKCVVDNSPANRYANPDKACRLIPMKWTKR